MKTDELAANLDTYKELEDKRIWDYLQSHNDYLNKINAINLDNAGTFQLGKCELLYSRARLYASLIAGHYRKLQKYHEAMAEQAQADMFESVRKGEYDALFKTGVDGQYLSRKAKGKQLEKAAQYEGDYIRWTGIANSYESAINSLKDMVKGVKNESNGGV